MDMAGTADMVVVGACITTPGCIPVGAIMTHGTQVITDTDMAAGMILGGVTTDTDTVAITADIMVIMATTDTVVTVADGMVVAATATSDVMPSRETVIRYPTTNVISFPMSEVDILAAVALQAVPLDQVPHLEVIIQEPEQVVSQLDLHAVAVMVHQRVHELTVRQRATI